MRPSVLAPIWDSEPVDAERVVCSVVVPGDPTTKARARIVAGRAYTPARTKEWQDYIGWFVRVACPGIQPNATHHLGIRIRFYTRTKQRRDLDNLVKLVLDACNGVVWHDDVQVVELFSQVVRGNAEPRTELIVYRIGESRFGACQQCGAQIVPRLGRDHSAMKYCSKACYDEAQRRGRWVLCSGCGVRIYRQQEKLQENKNFYCSRACRAAAITGQWFCHGCRREFKPAESLARDRHYCTEQCYREAKAGRRRHPLNAQGQCHECGALTSGEGRTRCIACWRKGHRGSNHPRARLNEDAVRDIRQQVRAGVTHTALAATYGVSGGTIGDVVAGRTWGHVEQVSVS
jgi:Holliday junction resolvase RusA-like endonuclease